MDILYVLGKGSKWDNNELRYSLRSIEKFGKNVGKVYVVGYNPGFLSNEITYIECKDKWSSIDSHKNILNCICTAIEKSDIDDEFLYSSDDHYYTKETDFNNYPYYVKGILPNEICGEINRMCYNRSLYDTRELLNKYDYTYYNFSQHGNTHFSRKAIELAKPLIEESYNIGFGCEPTCIVLNVLYKHKPFNYIERADVKVNKDIENIEGLKKVIKDREVFSIYDNAIDKGVSEYLQDLFPNKSKYEL